MSREAHEIMGGKQQAVLGGFLLLASVIGILLLWTQGTAPMFPRPFPTPLLESVRTDSDGDDSGIVPRRKDEEALCPMPGTGKFTLWNVPRTALVSFPGSGNTWTQFLLTTASGILTATVYKGNIVHVGPGRKNIAKRVIAVKTHKLPENTRDFFRFDRCLLLIRNPYDALLAEFNRQRVRVTYEARFPEVHTKAISPEDTALFKEWPDFVSRKMWRWSELYLAWIADCVPASSRLHALVYSRMMDHLELELRDVFQFLNNSNVITPRVHCAVRYREGDAHRAKHDWQNELTVFSDNQTVFLNAAIDQVQNDLEKATGEQFHDFQRWKR